MPDGIPNSFGRLMMPPSAATPASTTSGIHMIGGRLVRLELAVRVVGLHGRFAVGDLGCLVGIGQAGPAGLTEEHHDDLAGHVERGQDRRDDPDDVQRRCCLASV